MLTTTKVSCDSGCAESAGANGMSRELAQRGGSCSGVPLLPGQGLILGWRKKWTDPGS